jgi:Tol biopolymer transport system component
MKKQMIFTLAFVLIILSTNCDSPAQSSEPCSRIAYTYYSYPKEQNGDVYSVCADGSDAVRLTEDPAYDGARQLTTDLQNDAPIWLPDGEQIAIRTTDGQGLYWWRVLNLNTHQIVDLTEPSYDFYFQKQAWSPTDPVIAYMSLTEQAGRNDGSSQIHVKAIDGSYDQALTDNIWANVNPVWSPDGQRLAFLSEMHGEYNVFALYVMDADGGKVRQISEPTFTESAVYSWSPDGKQIAIGDIFLGHILLIDAASGRSRELVPVAEGETIMEPAWQPQHTDLKK